jgi:hypothetical protein
MSAAGWLFWIALTFAVACCVAMYLITRWTRPPMPTYFTTPPDISRCRNLQADGPTPCWHPHCDCMTDPYAEIAAGIREKMRNRFEAPRPRLGADEVLRRHIFSTRKAKHERARPKA